jgi:hypothetical protein
MAIASDWKIDEDRKTITITFSAEPPISLKLNTEEVDGLLGRLGALRSHMLPEHSYFDPRGKTAKAIVNPRFATETERLNEDIILHIRDPRYGTLTYMLPRENAASLGRSLVGLASGPRLGPPSGKAS